MSPFLWRRTRATNRDCARSGKPSLNWLLALVPVAVAGEHASLPAPWVFFASALAIVPIARLIVRSTEQLATYTGDTVGAACSTRSSARRLS